MKAYIFPGQGAQFPGMGKDLYEKGGEGKKWFDLADDILGFSITEIMFEGTKESLKETKVTQPAVFLHSVIKALEHIEVGPDDMVAGHSLGEISALVVNGTLKFEDGLQLVYKRAMAMQMACEKNPSTMAAILGLGDARVEEICAALDEVVVAANYNCPGQLVISGSKEGITMACEQMKAAGAKRALPLSVGGAFHSPLMEPAKTALAEAIEATTFHEPICPIYQNVDGLPSRDTQVIKEKLIEQLTSPVRWAQSVENMIADGAVHFIECGPGKVLRGLVKKIARETEVSGID